MHLCSVYQFSFECILYNLRTCGEDLTKKITDGLCAGLSNSTFVLHYFIFIIYRDYCRKYSHTVGLAFELNYTNLNSLSWRHLVSAWYHLLLTQVHEM